MNDTMTAPYIPTAPPSPGGRAESEAVEAILARVSAAVREYVDDATADGIVRATRRAVTVTDADDGHPGAEYARDVMADSLHQDRPFGKTPATEAVLDGRADESGLNVPTAAYLADLGGLGCWREFRARGHAYRAGAARLAGAYGPPPMPSGPTVKATSSTRGEVLADGETLAYLTTPDAPAIEALAELMESAAFPRFMHAVEWLTPARWANVRLGFYSTFKNTRATSGGWREHECALTGKTFWLPADAPCPAIIFDEVDPRGYVTGSESEGEDRGPWTRAVHPALFAGGPEAVLAAVWSRIHDLTRQVWAAFDEVGDWLTLTAEVQTPEDFGAGDPSAAYRARTGEVGGWRSSPPK